VWNVELPKELATLDHDNQEVVQRFRHLNITILHTLDWGEQSLIGSRIAAHLFHRADQAMQVTLANLVLLCELVEHLEGGDEVLSRKSIVVVVQLLRHTTVDQT
jgi:hypothetical protein